MPRVAHQVDTDKVDSNHHVEARADQLPHLGESNFESLVDNIPGLVFTLNPDGELEFVNQPALEYFGRTLEELKQWTTTDALHPADLPGVVAAWAHSVETGTPYEIEEHRLRRADGVYRWFSARVRPVRDADGRIVRWYSLLTDIEDRKRAEEMLRAREESPSPCR